MTDILTGLTFTLALYGLCHLIYLVFRSIRRGIEFKTYQDSTYNLIQIRIRKFSKSKSLHTTNIETLAPAVQNEVRGRE